MTNNLPKNWCECCIKDVANIQTGKLDANAAVENGNYPFFTCALEPLKINTFSFDGNCIYLPGNGANVGYVGYYQGKFDVYQRTYVLDKIAINERYLYFSILLNWKNYNKNKQFGVATNFIRLGNLENYPINLPPLEEQGRIVEKIEELFSDIDNGIKDLKIAQAQIKQYRQSVLKSAFDGKLYKTSEWKEVKLNSISMKIGSGATPKGGKHSYYKAGIPIIRSMNVLMNHFSSIGLAYLNDEQAKQLKNVITEKDDVLLNITGASIGRTCVLPDYYVNARVNQHVAIIRTTNKIVSKFLSFYLSTPYMQNKINNENYGVTRQALTKSTIENFDIPLPSLPEQQQIVAEIEKRFAVADEMEKAVNEGLEKADKLKQSILKKAFEGKLVPQDPNDEPAAVLLGRIKAAKENSTKGKK